jgi:hypothetical protein
LTNVWWGGELQADAVDQDPLPDVEGGRHGAARDSVWLDDKGLNQKRQSDGGRGDEEEP